MNLEKAIKILPLPVNPQNQWGCALASLSWGLHKIDRPWGQTEIIVTVGPHFPKWHFAEGIMGIGDILSVLSILQVPISGILSTDDHKELLGLPRRKLSKFGIGFITTTAPTNHCMGMGLWDDKGAYYMNAARPSAAIQFSTWQELKRKGGAVYTLLFH